MISILIFRTRYAARGKKNWAGDGARLAGNFLLFYYYSIAISYSECTFTVVIPVFMYTLRLVELGASDCVCYPMQDRTAWRESRQQESPHGAIYLQCPFTDIFSNVLHTDTTMWVSLKWYLIVLFVKRQRYNDLTKKQKISSHYHYNTRRLHCMVFKSWCE